MNLNCERYSEGLTAAARSICPGAAGFGVTPPGRAVVGIDGFPPTAGGFGGAPGFAPTGGGFGLAATGGGGLLARELEGLEVAGVLSDEPLGAPGVFFHGVADPFDGAIPGKTETGLADESAAIGLIGALAAVGAGVGLSNIAGAAGVEEGGRRLGGGGGGAAAGLGLGGTSSR